VGETLDDKVTSLFRYSLPKLTWGVYYSGDSAYLCNLGTRMVRAAGSELAAFAERMSSAFQHHPDITKRVTIDVCEQQGRTYLRFMLPKSYSWKPLSKHKQKNTGAVLCDGERIYFVKEWVNAGNGKREEREVAKSEPVFYLLLPLDKPEQFLKERQTQYSS